jgi:GNAT superfamily N-acetyltransferase
MILPDGYSDIPAGKIAAVVTHLEMTARPPHRDDPPGAWSLRKVDVPALDWYRDLFRRVGENWLWFSRARMSDAELAAIIHAAGIEIYALVVDGRDEGLLELDFREPGQCELVYFGVTASLIGTGAARFLMNRALERAWSGMCAASGCTPALSIIRRPSRSISARAFARSAARSRWRMIHASTARRRAMRRSTCR